MKVEVTIRDTDIDIPDRHDATAEDDVHNRWIGFDLGKREN